MSEIEERMELLRRVIRLADDVRNRKPWAYEEFMMESGRLQKAYAQAREARQAQEVVRTGAIDVERDKYTDA
jgi:hypothetical protein